MNIAQLTLREKAAQLIFPRIGSNMPPPVTIEEDFERVRDLLDRCPVGGLMLFNGQLETLPDQLAALQKHSRHPLLFATDMERGVGQQVRGATVFPHAMAFAAIAEQAGDAEAEAVLEQAARIQAREALACGIHITFAPVADVNRNPRNPIIATRAFGTDPERAGRLVQAYIRGCRAEGLLTTAKHFPGHGNTSTDSHAELPVISGSRDELERTDLVPFRAAIQAGADLAMTAHIVCPALDPEERPATLSRPILHTLLRETLGFRGAVITDSLLMGAIRDTHPDEGAQAVALVQAGVDILLDVADPERVADSLVQAVENGTLEAAQLEAACGRVWAMKQGLIDRFGAGVFERPADHFALEEVGEATHQAAAREVARRALQVESTPGVLPVLPEAAARDGFLAVLVKPHRSRLDPPEEPLGAAVREAYAEARYREVGPETDEETLKALLKEAADVKHVVVALVVKPAAWHAFGLLPAQQRFVEALLRQQPVLLASLGSPVILEDFPEAAARICTFSDVAPSQQALVAALHAPA